MNHVLETARFSSTSKQSPIGFTHKGGDNLFTLYLTLNGEPAYELGFSCGTCAFLFKRLNGANATVAPHELDAILQDGLTSIDTETLKRIEPIIPQGDYVVLLSEVIPHLVSPGDTNDYFSHEQIELWGINSFWGLPNYPQTEYYRTATIYQPPQGHFEFIVPMVPRNWLDSECHEAYRMSLMDDHKPTAITIAVLDIREPADWGNQTITQHWCLTHFLVDGHHKMFAAAQTNRPITMLSFLSIDESFANLAAIELSIKIRSS